MEYKVTIDKFEGPLDLLLHLIKKSMPWSEPQWMTSIENIICVNK